MPQTKTFVVVRSMEVGLEFPDGHDPEDEIGAALEASDATNVGDFNGVLEAPEGVTFDVDQDHIDHRVVEIKGAYLTLTPDNFALSRGLHGAPDETGFPYLDNRDPSETWIWLDAQTHIELTSDAAVAILRSFVPEPVEV
jgi:hypothetical protein